MTEDIQNNIIGFYASFNLNEPNKDFVKSYLWGSNGLKNKLAHLKWKNYGEDIETILFQIYVNPIQYERKNLREIESYRRKEKSIGIPIILDNDSFFKLTENEKQKFFTKIILKKLGLVELKVKQNKLNFDISQLIDDVNKSLNCQKN